MKNGEDCVQRSAALLHAMRKEIEWFVCQEGDDHGVIGVACREITLASNENWVLALQGGPIWNVDNELISVTEVVDSLNDKDVQEVLSGLAGQFSCAIYDKISNKLWLYSDKSGIYPLYWIASDNSITFASQPLCLATICLDKVITAYESGYGFLWGVPEYISGCLIDGLQLVSPGEMISWSFDDGVICSPIESEQSEVDVHGLRKILLGIEAVGLVALSNENTDGNPIQPKLLTAWQNCFESSISFLPVKNSYVVNLSMFLDSSFELCQVRCESPFVYQFRDSLLEARKKGLHIVLDCNCLPVRQVIPDDCIKALRSVDELGKPNANVVSGKHCVGAMALSQYANTYGMSVIHLCPGILKGGELLLNGTQSRFLIENGYRNVLGELLVLAEVHLLKRKQISQLICPDKLGISLKNLQDVEDEYFVERFEFVWRCLCLEQWLNMVDHGY